MPHSCVKCGRLFAQQSGLRYHLKKCNKDTDNDKDVHVDSDSGVHSKSSFLANAAFSTAALESTEPRPMSEDNHTMNNSNSLHDQLADANNVLFNQIHSCPVRQEDI